jgi:hypothetical protein
MATIRIQRLSEYNNRMRDYQVYIDHAKAGKIADGETIDFTVSPGLHTVTAKIDWCSSQDLLVTLKENETRNIKVAGFKHSAWIMPLAGGIIALHFILRLTFHIDYVIFLVIPFFLLLVYYMTFGRKKYLSIRESD